MKESSIYNIVANVILIFKERINFLIFFIALGFFLGLYGFFYGLFTIPMPEGVLGFYRMTPISSFEFFYMAFSAFVSALIITVTIHAMKLKVKAGTKGKTATAAGLTTGIFGAVCPACLGINFLAFGNVFTAQLAFLIPWIFWIQVGGLVFLSLGLYLVAKSLYEKKCISCSMKISNEEFSPKRKEKNNVLDKKLIVIVILVVSLFAYQLFTVFAGPSNTNFGSQNGFITTDSGEKIDINKVIKTVTPEAGFETSVRWGGIVAKMVRAGVLDPAKLENILKNRYGQEMKPQWRAILNGQDANLSINNDNAVFMMYVLWTFAKHNENQILTDSPFSKYFTNYDIGVGRAGYGDTSLLTLSSKEQVLAKKVAENAYRPCCGNSTAAPDCSHGYSALGLVQLMASQGFSEKEIFKTFVEFNSFWFPETYIKDALYFKITKGEDWKDVDKSLIASKKYSTLQGSYTVKNYLKNNYGI